MWLYPVQTLPVHWSPTHQPPVPPLASYELVHDLGHDKVMNSLWLTITDTIAPWDLEVPHS